MKPPLMPASTCRQDGHDRLNPGLNREAHLTPVDTRYHIESSESRSDPGEALDEVSGSGNADADMSQFRPQPGDERTYLVSRPQRKLLPAWFEERLRRQFPAPQATDDGLYEVTEMVLIGQLQYGFIAPETLAHIEKHYPELLIHRNTRCGSHPARRLELDLQDHSETQNKLHNSDAPYGEET